MNQILKYFPDLTENQIRQFSLLQPLYAEWNEKINVISRKDIDSLYEHHVLHSLAIAKFFKFKKGDRILDVGTGGGFPGIPLAIFFPEVKFFLLDSIAKKITVVKEVSNALQLENVIPLNDRVEKLKTKFDYIVSRAVTNFPDFINLTKNKYNKGIIYLKGGDFLDEIAPFAKKIKIINIDKYFETEYFTTKKIIYLGQQFE